MPVALTVLGATALGLSLTIGLLTPAANAPDNAVYISLAAGIRAGHVGPLTTIAALGLPVLLATLSWIPLTPHALIVAISIVSFLLSVAFIARLYGDEVALAFLAIGPQFPFVGATEALFIALLYGALLSARRERWALVAILSALSATVRPIGVFALVACAVVLIRHHRVRELVALTAIALGIGAVTFWLTNRLTGDPFMVLRAYGDTWDGRSPLEWPFHSALSTYRDGLAEFNWHGTIMLLAWFALSLVATVRLILRPSLPLADTLVAALSIAYLLCYPVNSIGQWMRWTLPFVPILLTTVRWPSATRRITWSAVLTVSVAFAIRTWVRNP